VFTSAVTGPGYATVGYSQVAYELTDNVIVDIRRVGSSALLIAVDEPLAWFEALVAAGLPVREIVPGAQTVLLDGVDDPEALTQRLRSWPTPRKQAIAEGQIDVPVTFDGEDLDAVAQHWRTSPSDTVDRITGTRFTVAFCGFAPGFAYLSGLETPVPRLDTPRPKVPAGSVGLAGPYAGIYPTASPGGWRLIGRTDIDLFDVDRQPPALLTPGTRVRLVAA